MASWVDIVGVVVDTIIFSSSLHGNSLWSKMCPVDDAADVGVLPRRDVDP